MTPLEDYLRAWVDAEGKTVPETSRYGILSDLLNAVGAGLQPPVKTFTHVSNTGAGTPDLAFFDAHQANGEKPAHGVIEAKPINANLMTIAQSKQVIEQYLPHYGQVLVTNYYQFVLVTRGSDGNPVNEEVYHLAPDANAFREALQQPRKFADEHSAALTEYLRRVMRRNAPMIEPRDVAWMLASYAREAKARTEAAATGLAALTPVRQQLEKALGLHFEDQAADEFFVSTLVQTLFYGVFSAWVLWYESKTDKEKEGELTFDLWNDIRDVSLPAIQDLFEEVIKPSVIRSLNLREVIDWTAKALNRVDKTAFFQRFERADAVQYFYEPFLEQFDPELRRQLGVWYTPPEIVEYMVARVDAALRDELGIRDGLLDDQVFILDPCCGTGAYLIHVLRHIYAKLLDRRGRAQAGQDIKRILQTRVFGFEILPAPFIVAHLQIGMMLNSWDAPLQGQERAGVYLTNALTGWEKPETETIALPGLRQERDAAEQVKQRQPILVILGNPPYSGYAGVAIEEESNLVTPYRTTVSAPAPQGQGLNDLYVRFFGMAERKIVGSTKRGIVCYISNYSWLDGLSHTGMRERYLNAFDAITIDSLNGDKYRTGKVTPDGKPDPSIFSTPFNREGIQVGTAIALMVRKSPDSKGETVVRYRDLWGTGKLAQLKAEAHSAIAYDEITPALQLGYPLMPRTTGANYLEWPKLTELFPESFPGVKTSRDADLIDIDLPDLKKRIEAYFNPDLSDEYIKTIAPDLMDSTSRFNAIETRKILLQKGIDTGHFLRYCSQPFDLRYIYWHPETKLLDEKREGLFKQIHPGNVLLACRQKAERLNEGSPAYATSVMPDWHMTRPGSICFPLYSYQDEKAATLFEPAKPAQKAPNLSEKAQEYLQHIGADVETLFYHSLAMLHSRAYLSENDGGMRQDWPRIPLPQNAEALTASAELGRQVTALLDVEASVVGINAGDPQPELKSIAVLEKNTAGSPDMNMTAAWGYFGRDRIVMPGSGKVVTQDDGSLDIYLNESTYWKNVPADVWEYTLGGYQVLKKWLSYRESRVLGRALKSEETATFTEIARRIAALLALSESLDANYRRASGA